MNEGTILTVNKINAMRQIVYLHILYLRKKSDNPQAFTDFVIDALKVDVKCAQHYIGIAYPSRKFSLEDLRDSFPMLFFEVPSESAHNLDYRFKVAATAAHNLKTNKFHKIFEKSTITVIEPSKKDLENTVALIQTGQKAPDYYILFPQKIHKYMDLKATLKYINRGHIIIINNVEDYNNAVKDVLEAQEILYTKKCPFFSTYIKYTLSKDDLTWHERNVAIQDFIMKNIAKLTEINPSIIIKEEFVLENAKHIKKYDCFVNSKSFISKEVTENTIASILNTDDVAKETYKYQYGVNKNIDKIVQALKEEPFTSFFFK
jgi:hypothetical protein